VSRLLLVLGVKGFEKRAPLPPVLGVVCCCCEAGWVSAMYCWGCSAAVLAPWSAVESWGWAVLGAAVVSYIAPSPMCAGGAAWEGVMVPLDVDWLV